MKHEDYWRERQEELEANIEKEEKKLNEKLKKIYQKEGVRLSKDIARYYEEYGTDGVIEYRTLLETLSPEDKAMLYERAEEFMEKYPEHADLMDIRESIYKLDRLEGLQASIYMQEMEIGATEEELITAHLNNIAEQSYNISARLVGAGTYNREIAKTFVDTAWSNGENYSTRIWNNKTKLTQYLQQDLAQGFARGDNYRKLTKQLMQRMEHVSRKDAYRLVYTEGTYVMAESSMQPFIQAGYETYSVSPLPGACPVCAGLEEQVFNIKDRNPGINFPPLHPYCRCTFLIEDVEDE